MSRKHFRMSFAPSQRAPRGTRPPVVACSHQTRVGNGMTLAASQIIVRMAADRV